MARRGHIPSQLKASYFMGISPSATHSQLKLMIREGKLTEMGHDPSNVQVIISDGDESGITICLVDDEGVIKRIDSVATHVIEESHEPSSALREVYNECERLRVQASTDATRIRSLEAELSEAKATIEQLRVTESATTMAEKIDRLKQVLAKESQKAKKFWKQKCDLMLRHEDEIDVKDTEIAVLKT